jgi:hypothetical protein
MKKHCPRCAERVQARALICRFCSYEFTGVSDLEDQKSSWTKLGFALAMLIALGGIGWLTFGVWRDLQTVRENSTDTSETNSPLHASIVDDGPQYEQIPLGSTFEWTSNDSGDETVRKAGPYLLTITKQFEDELTSPLIKVTVGGQSVILKGEIASPGFTNKISLVEIKKGSAPVVMLQSFSGGAHCCNHVQLAGFLGENLKVVDLGSWDGDEIELPKDISGDGVADFILRDDRFLYAFAPYAGSHSPPRIFNVTGGKVADVSRRPPFRKLFIEAVKGSGAACRAGGGEANGACPAYVAAAARVGRLDQAWSDMLVAYDAASDWDLPTACAVDDAKGCPENFRIVFKSYPEALLYFLKSNAYISETWQPAESFGASARTPSRPDWTT